MTTRPGFPRLLALALLSGCTFSPVRCDYNVPAPTCEFRSLGTSTASAPDPSSPSIGVREANGLAYIRVTPGEVGARELRIGVDGAEPKTFANDEFPVRPDAGRIPIQIHYLDRNDTPQEYGGHLNVTGLVARHRAETTPPKANDGRARTSG